MYALLIHVLSVLLCLSCAGGPGMVKAAYESGHPSIGVGAGNTPAVIDASADIPMAVSSILISKTFDNGVICASEQNMVVEAAVSSRQPGGLQQAWQDVDLSCKLAAGSLAVCRVHVTRG